MALTETLTDDFSADNRATKWPDSYGSTAVSGGVGTVTSTGASDYAGFQSSSQAYDIRTSWVLVKMTAPGGSGTFSAITLTKGNAGNDICAAWSAGTLELGLRTGYSFSSPASVALSSGATIWIGIGGGVAGAAKFGGTGTAGNLYWFTSTNGTTWTQRKTASTPAYANMLTVLLEAGEGSGTVTWDNYNVPLAGGTDYTKTPADPAAITDAASAVRGVARAPADAEGVSDTAVPQQALVRTQADPAVLTDAVSAALGMPRAVADPAGLTDAASAVLDAVRAPADSAGLTDASATVQELNRAPADPAGVTDAVTAAQGYARTAADTAALSDVIGAVQALVRDLADAVGITDAASASLAGTGEVSQTDAVGLSDAVTVIREVLTSWADPVGLTDSAAESMDLVRSQADSAALADAASALQALNRASADPLGLTDAATDAVGANRPPADSAGLTDALGASQALVRSPDDLAGLSDTITAILELSRPVTDQVSVTDAVTAVMRHGQQDLDLAAVPLGTRWTIAALFPRWAGVALPGHYRGTGNALTFTAVPLAARWTAALLPGETMASVEILASAGAVQYVGGTITETTGKDITEATFEISLGSETQPGRTWLTPDVSAQGDTTADRDVKLLVSADAPTGLVIPGTYWAWVRVTDSPETTPVRVQGPITVR